MEELNKNEDSNDVIISGPKTIINHPLLLPDGTKREKVKRLSVAVKGNPELFMASEVEDELVHRKFKYPKKVFCKPHPVNAASVPRKIRSAISKRNCESASVRLVHPKRRKSSDGVDPHRKDCLEKFKINMDGCSERSARTAVSVPITKEEEEVAETLFALAGMVPLTDQTFKAKTIGLEHDEPSSSSKDKGQLETAGNHSSSEAVDLSAVSSLCISAPAKCLSERIPLSCPKLSERRQLSTNLKVSVPPGHLQTTHPLIRTCDERKLGDSASSYPVSAMPGRQSGSNEAKLENVVHYSSQAQHPVSAQSVDSLSRSSGRRDNGLTPHLLLGSGVDRFPLQSSDMIFPSWLPTPVSSSSGPGSRGNTVSGDKVKIPSSAAGSRTSRKRNMTHVLISHLIQMSEWRNKRPLHDWQLRYSPCLSVPPEQNEIKGNITSHISGSTSYSYNNTGTRLLMNGQQMDTEAASKQIFNFLSMPSGVGLESINGTNRLSNGLDATNQVPPLLSVGQASASLPCSAPDNSFASSSYWDRVAVPSMALPSVAHQVHMQMPPYFANSFGPAAHMSQITSKSTTQSGHPKLQQQQIWAAQIAAKPGHLLPSQIANWQNRKQDLQTSSTYVHPGQASPQLSLETKGVKYLHSSQQQQLVGLCPRLPPSSSKLPNSSHPSNCEGMGGRFLPDGVMPFQLLSHER